MDKNIKMAAYATAAIVGVGLAGTIYQGIASVAVAFSILAVMHNFVDVASKGRSRIWWVSAVVDPTDEVQSSSLTMYQCYRAGVGPEKPHLIGLLAKEMETADEFDQIEFGAIIRNIEDGNVTTASNPYLLRICMSPADETEVVQ